MNRKELAALLSEKHDLSKVGATRILDSVFEALTAELKKGNPVALSGFGTFKVTARAARMGRNPSTGDKVKIAARKLVKFTPASALAGVVDPKFAKARAEKAAARKTAAEAEAPKASAKKSAAGRKTAAAATEKKAAPAKKAGAKAAAKSAPAKKAAAKKKA